MIYKLPITLEDGQVFESLPITSLSFSKVSGYDGNGLRVTNLVGFSNGDFLKECPNCGQIKYSRYFGLRTTVNRDQSNCISCRSNSRV